MNLIDNFQIQLRNLSIRKGSKLLVACSGGSDSVALLHLLLKIRKSWRLHLGVMHFNHQLRGQAANEDEAFVKRIAQKHRLKFYGGRAKVLKHAKEERYSLEEAARLLRYEFFCKTAKEKGFQKVLLAQHLGDQAETVLMRVIKGTGLRGLRGIQPKLKMKGIHFLRPLLSVTKEEILEFLKTNKIKYRKDKSNHSKRFLRNQLRLELIPYLQEKVNPRVIESVSRLPAILGQEITLLEKLEDHAWKQVYQKKVNRKLLLSKKEWDKLDPALQFRVLHRALRKLDPKSGLSFDAWSRLRAKSKIPPFRCSLARNIDFSLTPLKLELCKK